MAAPTMLMLGASEKVYFIRDQDGDDFSEGIAEECALTVTYQLEEGDDLSSLVREKAAEIGCLHAIAQKTVRLARADCKMGRTPEQPPNGSPPALPRPATVANENHTESHPNGVGEPPINGAQRMAIEEHFRRLRYSDQEVFALINGRFAKSRLAELSSRQASALLGELQHMAVDSTKMDDPNRKAVSIPVNGRHRSKRIGF